MKIPAKLKKYDRCICPGYFFKPRRTAIKVEIFHSVCIDSNAVSHKALRFDKLFILGSYMHDKFISTGILAENDSCFKKIGMPKVDCLADGSLYAAAIRKELDIDNDLPTVLYAPTRSVTSGTSLEHAGDLVWIEIDSEEDLQRAREPIYPVIQEKAMQT